MRKKGKKECVDETAEKVVLSILNTFFPQLIVELSNLIASMQNCLAIGDCACNFASISWVLWLHVSGIVESESCITSLELRFISGHQKSSSDPKAMWGEHPFWYGLSLGYSRFSIDGLRGSLSNQWSSSQSHWASHWAITDSDCPSRDLLLQLTDSEPEPSFTQWVWVWASSLKRRQSKGGTPHPS